MDPLLFQSQLDVVKQNEVNRYRSLLQKNENKIKDNTKSAASFDKMLSESRKKLYDVSSEKLSPLPAEKQIQEEIKNSPEKQKLFEAAKEFETFFIEKVFKEMKRNVPKTGWIHGGRAEEIFDDMLMTERVKVMSRHTTFGLAEQIYHQMSKQPR